MIHGRNLLKEVDGAPRKAGFYVNVFVEAFAPADAEARAIEIIREDGRLREILLNPEYDMLRLSVEGIQELESFDGCKLPRQGLVFYPEDEG